MNPSNRYRPRARATAADQSVRFDPLRSLALMGFVIALVMSLCVVMVSAARAGNGDTASAALENPDGEAVGMVEITQLENGASVIAHLKNLPEGTHAFHIHGTGDCAPPFKSAGGHYNPTDAKHGFDVSAGPHAGDLPNIYVPASGELTVEMFDARLKVNDSLLDDDGAAVVIHEGADDYQTDPAGDAGSRIACGVLEGPR